MHLGGERHCEIKVLPKNTAQRPRTRTAPSGVQRANHLSVSLTLCFFNFSDESVTFQCDLSRGNISQLHVFWYEKAGNSQEKLIISNNDSFTLTVQGTLTDSMESHVILYRCTVQNTDGVSSSPSAKLVVLRKGNSTESLKCFASVVESPSIC